MRIYAIKLQHCCILISRSSYYMLYYTQNCSTYNRYQIILLIRNVFVFYQLRKKTEFILSKIISSCQMVCNSCQIQWESNEDKTLHKRLYIQAIEVSVKQKGQPTHQNGDEDIATLPSRQYPPWRIATVEQVEDSQRGRRRNSRAVKGLGGWSKAAMAVDAKRCAQ